MKDKGIYIRASQTEHSQIQAKAKAAGVTMSELILASALRRRLPSSKTTDIQTYSQLCQIKTEINRIGVNLNQIAKACNTSRLLGEPVVVNTLLLDKIKQHLEQIEQQVNIGMSIALNLDSLNN